MTSKVSSKTDSISQAFKNGGDNIWWCQGCKPESAGSLGSGISWASGAYGPYVFKSHMPHTPCGSQKASCSRHIDNCTCYIWTPEFIPLYCPSGITISAAPLPIYPSIWSILQTQKPPVKHCVLLMSHSSIAALLLKTAISFISISNVLLWDCCLYLDCPL